MNIVLFGAGGTLGVELATLIRQSGHYNLSAFTSKDGNIADENRVAEIIRTKHPRIIINAAGYNDVDRAEDEEALAYRINSTGAFNVARQARHHDAILIHYSTDFVFDGEKGSPYSEEDIPHPLSIYARSKYWGELAAQATTPRCYILRTSSIFGRHGNNFLTRFLRLADEHQVIRMVDDLIGSPTAAVDLAKATLALVEKEVPFGLYHVAGKAACSRWEWARGIVEAAHLTTSIEPTSLCDLPLAAPRPRNASLNSSKLAKLGIHLRPWNEALPEMFL